MSWFIVAVTLLCALASAAAVAQDLALGETVTGATTSAAPASYAFTAESSGVLAVFVRADHDVVINVVDKFGQSIDNGYIDTDYGGDAGAEQGAMIIGEAGDYQVRVEPLSSDADFILGATWLPTDAVGRKPDPQGSPEESILMGIGKIYNGFIRGAVGDDQDWFRIVAARDGVLNVATRTRASDVVLDYYQDGNFTNFTDHSDQDLDGDSGRESITLNVHKGGVYFFVVTAYGSDADYSIRAVISDR